MPEAAAPEVVASARLDRLAGMTYAAVGKKYGDGEKGAKKRCGDVRPGNLAHLASAGRGERSSAGTRPAGPPPVPVSPPPRSGPTASDIAEMAHAARESVTGGFDEDGEEPIGAVWAREE